MKKERYRSLRLQLGLTQAELAATLEVSLRTVKARESGEAEIGREAELAILKLKEDVTR